MECQLRYLVAILPSSRRTSKHSSRGFTLVELMAVVVMVGVLSLAAVAGFRRHMQSARGVEAVAVIQATRSAEEAYMAENHVYLNVSQSGGGAEWYPRVVLDGKRVGFRNEDHGDYARWRQLAPSVKQDVMFGYLVNAGVSGASLPTLQVKANFASAPAVDWYVIQANGGSGAPTRYASSSMTGEIYTEEQ